MPVGFCRGTRTKLNTSRCVKLDRNLHRASHIHTTAHTAMKKKKKMFRLQSNAEP